MEDSFFVTQPPTQWLLGVLARGWPGRDADYSPPSNAEVENEELYFLSPLEPVWSNGIDFYFTIQFEGTRMLYDGFIFGPYCVGGRIYQRNH
jgi:hypothetical protein